MSHCGLFETVAESVKRESSPVRRHQIQPVGVENERVDAGQDFPTQTGI